MGRTDQAIVLLLTNMHLMLTLIAGMNTPFLYLFLMMMQRTPGC